MRKIEGFQRGMGIGGWLTNYKRFNVLPIEHRFPITEGDMEHFRGYITRADVENIRDLGMDHIRLGFDQIVVEESPGVWREEIFDILLRFADWCRECGLRLVLNMHKAVGNYCDIPEKVSLFDSPELQRRFLAVWEETEKRFADHPEVMLEPLNEVRDFDPELWNELAARTVEMIRRTNPTRDVFLGSTNYGDPAKLRFLRLFPDEHVHYTFHSYAPFEFTHQRGVLQAAPLYYNRALSWPCDDVERYRGYYALLGQPDPYPGRTRMDRSYLEEVLAPAVEFAKAHPDVLLWNGEFGTIRHADPASRANWMRDTISILRENEIPYCVWNYLSTPNDGNRFSLVDDDTRKILTPELAKAIRGE